MQYEDSENECDRGVSNVRMGIVKMKVREGGGEGHLK